MRICLAVATFAGGSVNGLAACGVQAEVVFAWPLRHAAASFVIFGVGNALHEFERDAMFATGIRHVLNSDGLVGHFTLQHRFGRICSSRLTSNRDAIRACETEGIIVNRTEAGGPTTVRCSAQVPLTEERVATTGVRKMRCPYAKHEKRFGEAVLSLSARVDRRITAGVGAVIR